MKRVLSLLLGLVLLAAVQPAQGATSYSSCLLLPKPQFGDLGWSTILNLATTLTDSAIAGILTLSVAGNTDVVLTSTSGSPDQARNAHFVFTGTLTGNIKVFWPAGLCRVFSVQNSTSGAFTLTVAANNGSGSPAGTTVAVPQGGSALLVSDGVNVTTRSTATNSAYINGVQVDWTNHGQGRLTFVSASQVRFCPYNGNRIYIPGTGVMAIPSGCVTMGNNAGLTEGGLPAANTTYFIYAFNSGGALALQPSATGHATDTSTGVEIRSGDSSRVLVGMARMNGSIQFADSVTQRFVASWFNRRSRSLKLGQQTIAGFSTSGSQVGLGGTTVEFVGWNDDDISFRYAVSVATTGAPSLTAYIAPGVDSNTTPSIGNVGTTITASNLSFAIGTVGISAAVSDGYHFVTAIGTTTNAVSVTYQVQGEGIVRQ